jgi:hypothetical protein
VDADDERLLFDLGDTGQRLTIRLLGPYSPSSADLDARSWSNAAIEVDAHPFKGTIETVLTADDVSAWTLGLSDFADGSERCALGGGRAAEIILEREGTVVEVAVTPSGDSPWPRLRYLVFNPRIVVRP